MRYILRDEVQAEGNVFANIPAVRCDAIALHKRDVVDLLNALQSNSHEQVTAATDTLERWLCQFAP